MGNRRSIGSERWQRRERDRQRLRAGGRAAAQQTGRSEGHGTFPQLTFRVRRLTCGDGSLS
jgi:hypothetical protein